MGNGILEEWNIGRMDFEDRDCLSPTISSALFHIIPSFHHSIFPEDWTTGEI
jgi:hypothetical protein